MGRRRGETFLFGAGSMLGWSIHLAHPADRPITCKVTQVQRSDQFTDCEGRTMGVDGLALPPKGVAPDVSNDGILTLDVTPD